MVKVMGILVLGMFFLLGVAVGIFVSMFEDRRIDENLNWIINYCGPDEGLFNTSNWFKDEIKARFPPTPKIPINLWFMLVDWDAIRKANGELREKLGDGKCAREGQDCWCCVSYGDFPNCPNRKGK